MAIESRGYTIGEVTMLSQLDGISARLKKIRSTTDAFTLVNGEVLRNTQLGYGLWLAQRARIKDLRKLGLGPHAHDIVSRYLEPKENG